MKKIINNINNKKGFTLVELLAIIVILAVILVITVPAVFDAIDSSKKESFINEAKALSKWVNDITSMDEMLTGESIPYAELPVNGEWKCIVSGGRIAGKISINDIIIKKTDDGKVAPGGTIQSPAVSLTTCSAIYNNNSSYEILLMAKENGKFFTHNAVKGQAPNWVMYATSTSVNSWAE